MHYDDSKINEISTGLNLLIKNVNEMNMSTQKQIQELIKSKQNGSNYINYDEDSISTKTNIIDDGDDKIIKIIIRLPKNGITNVSGTGGETVADMLVPNSKRKITEKSEEVSEKSEGVSEKPEGVSEKSEGVSEKPIFEVSGPPNITGGNKKRRIKNISKTMKIKHN